MDPRTRLPINSITATIIINCLLALITLGALEAFDVSLRVLLNDIWLIVPRPSSQSYLQLITPLSLLVHL